MLEKLAYGGQVALVGMCVVFFALFLIILLVKLMTLGGPANKTAVLSYSIYKEAFLNNRWGYASAQSVVFLVILLTISIIQFRIEKKGVFYQ